MSVASAAGVPMSLGRRKTLIQIGRYFVVLVATLVVAFPIYWLFIMAFKSAEEMYAVPPVYFPADPSFGFRVDLVAPSVLDLVSWSTHRPSRAVQSGIYWSRTSACAGQSERASKRA